MPDYRITINFEDEIGGTTSKQFLGTFADYATASAKAAALVTDVDAIVTAGITTWELAEITVVGGAAGAGSRVFERVDATLQLNDQKKVNFKMPSPLGAIFAGNALNIAATAWTDLMANFTAGEWTVSDGDNYMSTVKGKRVFVKSGTTNLPS